MTARKFCMLLSMATGVAVGAEMTSPPSVVWMDPEGSLFWKTVLQSPIPISVDWPDGAASATLVAKAGEKEVARTVLGDTSVRCYSLEVDFPMTEAEESVLDLSLEFADANGTVLSTRTASVGLVRGVGGRSFRLIPDGEGNAKWKKVRGSAVAPVYADTDSVTFDGSPLPLTGTPGWTYLSGVSPATHSLVLNSKEGDSIDVPIVGIGGLMIIFK